MPSFICLPTTGGASAVASVGGAGFSVLLDGIDYLANTSSDSVLGFANAWSISIWAKPDLDEVFGTRYILNTPEASGGDASHIVVGLSDAASPFFAVVLWTSAGILFKNYRWDAAIADNVWQHWIVTWNGTTLTLYYNGSSQVPDATPINNAGTMDNAARDVVFGIAGFDLASFALQGNLGHAAIWSTVLGSTEVTEIFNGKHAIDLGSNTGNYTSSASLVHYYRLGLTGFPAGWDDEAGSISLDDSIVEDADIVEDAPA